MINIENQRRIRLRIANLAKCAQECQSVWYNKRHGIGIYVV